jgi:glycosyltransferase involved in cell wall biosynthesis
MKERKLTITIPVYERYEYFEEALMSAINQSIPVDVIVVDNASSHNKFEVFIKSLNLVTVSYFRNDTNLGLYGNWNRCIELCQTEFVMILGSDDIVHKDYSTVFYNRLAEFPDIYLFHTDISRFGNMVESHVAPSKMPIGYHSGVELLKYTAVKGLGFWTIAMAFSKSVYPEYKFEYPGCAYSQDWLFAYQAFTNKQCFGEARKLVNYRVHKTGNATSGDICINLSAALVYHKIKVQLKELYIEEFKKAKLQEINVLRNTIISNRNVDLIKIIDDNNNVFTNHISFLIQNDLLSRTALKNNRFIKNIILFYFRIVRKLQRL